MFGVTEQDYFLSNARVRGITTAGKLTIGDTPYNSREYSVIGPILLDNSINPVEYNLVIPPMPRIAGDVVMVLFRIANVSGVNPGPQAIVKLPSNVYCSWDNEPAYSKELNMSYYEQVQLQLIYNGSVFVNTFEFC